MEEGRETKGRGTQARCVNPTRGRETRGRGENALKRGARTLREAETGERAKRGAEEEGEERGRRRRGGRRGERRIIHVRIHYICVGSTIRK